MAGPRVFFAAEGWVAGQSVKNNGGILGDTELFQQNPAILRAVSRFLSRDKKDTAQSVRGTH